MKKRRSFWIVLVLFVLWILGLITAVQLQQYGRIFPLFIGFLLLILAFFIPQINQRLGLYPRSQNFTVPRFQWSAQVTQHMNRWILGCMGISSLFQGLAGWLIAENIAQIISIIFIVGAGIGILTVLIITLLNWRL